MMSSVTNVLILIMASQYLSIKQMTTVVLMSILLLAVYKSYVFVMYSNVIFKRLPDIDLEELWGPANSDESIRYYDMLYLDNTIEALRDRLKKYRYFPSLNGTPFQYGFNSDTLVRWIRSWQLDKYNCSNWVNRLNKFPHYETNIQGLNIHFVRVMPKDDPNKTSVPLLLLHGWPSSVREFYDAIPHLTALSEDRDFAVEVVVPSLPGYGFSDATSRPGLGADKMAVIFRNLMHRLGHKQFYVQGGDWGSLIGRHMATFFPEEVLGYHSTFPVFVTPSALLLSGLASMFPRLLAEPNVAELLHPLTTIVPWIFQELGYTQVFTCVPDTFAVGLSDSPAGLLAVILQKFAMASNKSYRELTDGGLSIFSREQILDNVMLYWLTNTMASSMRIYAETFGRRHMMLGIDSIPSPVPTCVILAKNDVAIQPPFIIKMKHPNLLRTTIVDGGHHLALEKPKVFADDVLESIGEIRRWHERRKTEL